MMTPFALDFDLAATRAKLKRQHLQVCSHCPGRQHEVGMQRVRKFRARVVARFDCRGV